LLVLALALLGICLGYMGIQSEIDEIKEPMKREYKKHLQAYVVVGNAFEPAEESACRQRLNLPAEGGEREPILSSRKMVNNAPDTAMKGVAFDMLNDSESSGSEYVNSSYWSDESSPRSRGHRRQETKRNKDEMRDTGLDNKSVHSAKKSVKT